MRTKPIKFGKNYKVLVLTGIILFVSFFFLVPKSAIGETNSKFWEFQCIDTMKMSRDTARKWPNKQELQNHIDWEMKTILETGANCVAIDTPYDEEFVPFLTKWVEGARKRNLHIWFRGNFSGWEEWFNYPKLKSTDEFFKKLDNFIVKHEDLFADGDIFTGAPEAENGGPFNQVEKDEHEVFRKFLIEQYATEKIAFEKIGKNVELNWFSMNGGLAKRMMDQSTADSLGNVVAIDHYIKNSLEMGEFISYFKQKFDSNVVIGEFGAPIPEINGNMSENEQAEFIDSLFYEMYKHKESVVGINYWDLYDGSAALMNINKSPRKVLKVVEKYFSPAVIHGTITNEFEEKLQNVLIKTNDDISSTTTDAQGKYSITVVPGAVVLVTNAGEKHTNLSSLNNVPVGKKVKYDIVINQKGEGILYQLKIFFYKLFNEQ